MWQDLSLRDYYRKIVSWRNLFLSHFFDKVLQVTMATGASGAAGTLALPSTPGLLQLLEEAEDPQLLLSIQDLLLSLKTLQVSHFFVCETSHLPWSAYSHEQ